MFSPVHHSKHDGVDGAASGLHQTLLLLRKVFFLHHGNNDGANGRRQG